MVEAMVGVMSVAGTEAATEEAVAGTTAAGTVAAGLAAATVAARAVATAAVARAAAECDHDPRIGLHVARAIDVVLGHRRSSRVGLAVIHLPLPAEPCCTPHCSRRQLAQSAVQCSPYARACAHRRRCMLSARDADEQPVWKPMMSR